MFGSCSLCRTIPYDAMVVSSEPKLSPQFRRKVVLSSSRSPVERVDFTTPLPSDSLSVFYDLKVFVKEPDLTLSEDCSWVAAAEERTGSRHLGDDLPNEAVVSRKKQVHQIRHWPRGKASGFAYTMQLNQGLPCLPRTRLPTFPLKRAVKLRQCPGGKTGSGGGGAGGGASGSGGWGGSSFLASGNEFLSSLVIGRGGNSDEDDDDPFRNNRPVDLPRLHYEDFNPFEFIDKDRDPLRDIPNLDDLLHEITLPSMESVSSNQPFMERRSAPVFREDISDPAPMTPAPPMTPGAPMTPAAPVTPGYSATMTPSASAYLIDSVQAMTLGTVHLHSSTMTLPLAYGPSHAHSTIMPASDPVHGSLVSPHQAQTPEKSELESLLEINRLLRKSSADNSHPRPPSGSRRPRRTPYTAPHSVRPHTTMRTPQPPAVAVGHPVQRVHSPKTDHTPEHFFKTTYVVQDSRLVIGLQVDPLIASSSEQIAHQALLHCYQLCMRYKDCLDQQYDLAVAMQNKARLCDFSFDFQKMKLSFTMPSDCE